MRKMTFFLLTLIVLTLLSSTFVLAQDDSPTLPNPVQPVETTGNNVIINAWAAVTGIVMAFLAGGVVGIAGIGVLMT